MIPAAGLAADGSVYAISYKPLPADSTIAVRPWDDSRENLELAEEFKRVLGSLGYKVADNAALVLSFETRDILGSWSAGERRSILEIEGHGGRRGGEDASVRLNLYESSRGGMFNEGRAPAAVVPSKYQLEVTLDRKAGGRLWQGHASAALQRLSGFELVKSMIPVVAEHLGKTVRRKTFTLKRAR